MEQERCTICGSGREVSRNRSGEDSSTVNCKVCGHYRITGTAESTFQWSNEPRRYILQGYVRQENEEGREPFFDTESLRRHLEEPPVVRGVLAKLDRLLLYVASKSEGIGVPVLLRSDDDYPIAYAKGPREFDFMVNHLSERGLTKKAGDQGIILTFEGWKTVDELRTSTPGMGNRCFIAMWFDPEMDDVYSEGIEPAVKEADYECVRVDREPHNDKICDRIIAEIRRAKFIVADFTEHRGGVYFEAGFALGMGIPVIWTCRKDQLAKSHFDTRQYNHVVWSTPEDLREKLLDRIQATIK